MTTLSECKTLSELNSFVQGFDHMSIGEKGGRKIIDKAGNEHSISQVSKKFFSLCKKSAYTEKEAQLADEIANKISDLNKDEEYKKGMTKGAKAKLSVRRAFGNVFGLSSRKRTPEKIKEAAFGRMYIHYEVEVTHLRRNFLKALRKNLGESRETQRLNTEIKSKTTEIKKTAQILNPKFENKIQKNEKNWDKAAEKFQDAFDNLSTLF